MKFIYHANTYNAKNCCLSVEEIVALHERLDAAAGGSLVPCSDKEMLFLHECEPYQGCGQEGDLRDEFAKAALEGTLANGANELGELADDVGEQCMLKRLTSTCYRIADAMMTERSRRHEVHV